jgi:hypothetical protein
VGVRWTVLLGLLVAAPASAGLFGSDAPARIPIPARVFHAEVEDVGGTALRIERLTFDGEVFLFGRIGLAQVTVPFEQIATVTFAAGPDADHKLAVISPIEGEEIRLVVEADQPIWGRTTFGNYKIEVSDVRRLIITSFDPPQ